MRYGSDVLAGDGGTAGKPPVDPRRRTVPTVAAEIDLVVETADGRFCGAVTRIERAVVAGEHRDVVVLADRRSKERSFPMLPAAFAIDGTLVTLIRPDARPAGPAPARRTASGSVAVAGVTAQVAKASRIWVEGVHDAALLERIWGEDLRIEGIVVEPLGGIDDLHSIVRTFAPNATRRLGVLVDHLVPGSKETRIVEQVRRDPKLNPHVLVNGHPYIDIWQAVTPKALGIPTWPDIPRGQPWKEGIAAALGVSDPQQMWRQVLAAVSGYGDVEVPLIRAVEELIDFVTVGFSG
jgi:Protein of unknown function (DUF3097)